MEQIEGTVKGYFLFGENPAVGSANTRMQRLGMSKLDWLVVRDFSLIESATWWKDGPEIESGEMRTEEIATEVFFFPAAAHIEKDGTFTNTQRMLQWHHKAQEPVRRAAQRPVVHLPPRPSACASVWRARRRSATGRVLELTWDYPTDGRARRAERRGGAGRDQRLGRRGQDALGLHGAEERRLDALRLLDLLRLLRGRRQPDGATHAEGAAELDGAESGRGRGRRTAGSSTTARRPTRRASRGASARRSSGGTRRKAKWTGHDTPDFEANKPPDYRPPKDASGPDAIAGDTPFIMQADGRGWLFAPAGVADGPMPTHYEPQDSPVANTMYPERQRNPAREVYEHENNRYHPDPDAPGGQVYPIVVTTYRLTEHFTAGGMSRWTPYLAELQPEFFCEVSPELAEERGLEHAGWATLISARGAWRRV